MKGESLSVEGVRVTDSMRELCPSLLDVIGRCTVLSADKLLVCGELLKNVFT